MADVRLRLHAAGFDPCACRGKEALMVGWNKKYTAEEVSAWANQYPAWTNTGIRTANAPALDIDIKNPEAARASEDLIRNLYSDRGTLLTRIGEAPKRALLFRTAQPFSKIRVNFVAPNGSRHHIEVLGDGQQIVVDGIHPTTKKPYCWQGGYTPGDIPWSDLPEIDEAEARSLVTLVSEMLVTEFGFQETEASNLRDEARKPVDAEAELAAMAPAGKTVNEVQARVIPSLLRRALSPQAVLDLVVGATMAMATKHGLAWTREVEVKAVTLRITSALNLIQRDHVPSGTIPNWLADEFVEDWLRINESGGQPQLVRNRGGWYVRNTPRRGKPTEDGNPDPHEKHPGNEPDPTPTEPQNDKHTWPTPYANRDASQIPRRAFILGQHYLLGAVTITVAGGGVGKSTLTLLEAISFAIGRDLLLGEPLAKRRRVWIWNGEDDQDEMERRVIGICGHYNVNRADLYGWLFLDSGLELPLDLASGLSGRTVLRSNLLDTIAARVRELQIEVVGLDPLVALHTMQEGDNPGHASLIRTIARKIAKPCGCAVDINHHPRKTAPGQDNGITADDIRGASSIVHSARSARLLHQMTLAEAEKYGIEADDRYTYYRIERAKANMAKRGTICWVHAQEVPIANGAGGAYGDVVVVPTVWTPPDAMAGVSDIAISAIRNEISNGEYRRDARAGAAWAGKLVALRLGLDLGTRAGKNRATSVLDYLIRKGVLTIEIRYDKNRNAREYVVPGTTL
jgi:hypothetical protein